MSLLPTLALAASLFIQGGSQTPLKLKPGDEVSIVAPGGYGGEFTIMSDGAIYGRGFGRVILAGQSVPAGEKIVRTALSKFVKEQNVFFLLKSQRPEFIYLVGQSGGQGPSVWKPELTLRQVISNLNLTMSLDEVEVNVLREGTSIFKSSAQETLQVVGTPDLKLSANDVVTVLPMSTMRIWVSGAVRSPGEFKLRPGSDLSRALASAGGFATAGDTTLEETEILVRRGPNVARYPALQVAQLKNVSLEAGDDISVVASQAVRITVAGEVVKPGELMLRGGAQLAKAIAQAGGATTKGTLAHVKIVRQGEVLTADASQSHSNFELQSNDLVVVERNERCFYVLGEVAKPGRFPMEDNRVYRLSDALATADGLSGKGTYRRVYLARPGKGGKTEITQVNLDEYLKDGKLSSNPEIQPGDYVLFGQSNGLSFGAVNQVLSSFLILNSLVGKN